MPAPFVSGNDVCLYRVQIAAVPTKCAAGDGGDVTNSNCASLVIELGCQCRDGHSGHRSMSTTDRDAARRGDTDEAGSGPDDDDRGRSNRQSSSGHDAETQTGEAEGYSIGCRSLGGSTRRDDGNKPVHTDIPVAEERNPNTRPQISIPMVSTHNVPEPKLGFPRTGTSTQDASRTRAIDRSKCPGSKSGSATELGWRDPLPASEVVA